MISACIALSAGCQLDHTADTAQMHCNIGRSARSTSAGLAQAGPWHPYNAAERAAACIAAGPLLLSLGNLSLQNHLGQQQLPARTTTLSAHITVSGKVAHHPSMQHMGQNCGTKRCNAHRDCAQHPHALLARRHDERMC